MRQGEKTVHKGASLTNESGFWKKREQEDVVLGPRTVALNSEGVRGGRGVRKVPGERVCALGFMPGTKHESSPN